MALWMPAGAVPETEEEKADLDAISALRESAAIELKEQGNEYVKKGKKHYADALDSYTRAINQKSSDPVHNSVCFANRAHVHLLLGNNRRAYDDAQEAVKLNEANIKYMSAGADVVLSRGTLRVLDNAPIHQLRGTDKLSILAYFRGAKAALALGLLPEASHLSDRGLQHDPTNDELRKLKDRAKKLQAEEDARKTKSMEAHTKAEELATVLESRKVKVGKATYRQITGNRKPWLDSSGMLHWPVLLLHGEVMVSDFIEDFCETDLFLGHLDLGYGDDQPSLVWDTRHEYTRNRVELYYQVNVGKPLLKKQVVQWLLEDKPQTQSVEDDDDDAGFKKQRWVKVDERATLHSVLAQSDHIVPGVPGLFLHPFKYRVHPLGEAF